MAASPKWKVFDSDGTYRASTKAASDGVLLAQLLGRGSDVRLGHNRRSIVWVVGRDEIPLGGPPEVERLCEERARASRIAVRGGLDLSLPTKKDGGGS